MPPLFSSARRPSHRRINLALQGGGAHGAFTWGVLDALLEDGRIIFDGISGASAGAMNAAVTAQGLMSGGADGARAALARFWTAVAASVPDGLDAHEGSGALLRAMTAWTQFLSPEQLNPFDLNPLREILKDQLDFAALRKHSPVRLFVAATAARSGRLRLFRNAELSAEVLLASACLPSLYRAVEVNGEPCWDGAYAANPPIFPLLLECKAHDLLLVLLSPLEHQAMPGTANGIQARAAEIGFTAGFLREMQMLALMRQGRKPAGALRRMLMPDGSLQGQACQARFHMIGAGDLLDGLGAESKLAANLRFFERLKAQGREQGQRWLREHAADLGRRNSVDIGSVFA